MVKYAKKLRYENSKSITKPVSKLLLESSLKLLKNINVAIQVNILRNVIIINTP